ncbi:uroporphyrinogen-III C-methyltransferase [Clostridium cylindrosporum]|uniref:uroporphyrinogen-III C-methyltransferase n=1 Tax=Clostridium cylindrosporum DSM 605 TaxID=1121307 RepID=A0A0J8D6Z2_CLOCY|nr:uroporphyrinogen-III C-methyltransferase [Clostridium cylindrosporum]KMT21840.1 porphyrin biosynthesis protein HemD [Clostridium cylindrosporum DSM 605]
MGKGKVWLVGAGPSDVGLFTLKGREVLEKADVVVYDKLVGGGILSLIPNETELIYVGKTSGNHPVPQDRINEILLEEALKGKNVARLKGGDPFLFGRGGEELELLVEHGIEFEIVPGITSAISVPAYAGIPVTHRDFTSSLHIITGHTKKESAPSIDFESLVKLNGTLVFLMGVSSLEVICKGLIDAGMDKTTPAAIIESGTTSRQRKVVSTVEYLSSEARDAKIKTPGLIIVGKVAQLSDKFSWAEKRPLAGTKVLVTRPKSLASRLSKKLYDNGAEVIELPTIETKAIEDNSLLLGEIKNIKDYGWIVFTSPTGVNVFFESLKVNSIDIRSLLGVKFAAVGSATAKAIEDRGIIVDFIPSMFNGKVLAIELSPKVNGEKVMIPRAKDGTLDIVEEFKKANIDYRDIPIYETIIKETEVDNIEDFDYVAFTSASTVKGFVNSVKTDYSRLKAICIGESTEGEAKKYSMETFVAKRATLDSMVELLIELRGN